jgi:hypothetical protein
MKKTILLSFIICLSALSSFSQKLSLGPELGVNIIPLESTGYGYNYQLGFHFGGHLKYHFSEKFKLSTGIFLTQKKVAYNYSETNSVLSQLDGLSSVFGGGAIPPEFDSIIDIPGINLDMTEETRGVNSEIFIEIPLMANYKYKNVNFYLGPYFGILLSASQKEEITTKVPVFDFIDVKEFDSTGFISAFLPQSGTESSSSSGTDGLRILDIGANVGIGYEMNNLHFNLMYSQGFLDYRNDRNGESLTPLKTIRISMVYLFNLEGKKEPSPRLE